MNWFYSLSLVVFLLTAAFTLLFGRLSFVRIERDIILSGLPRPCSWDGMGIRLLTYAYSVGLPEPWAYRCMDARIVDVALIRRFAKPLDITLGAGQLISSWMFLILVLVHSIID